jgi:hypothetical protein
MTRLLLDEVCSGVKRFFLGWEILQEKKIHVFLCGSLSISLKNVCLNILKQEKKFQDNPLSNKKP